MRRGFLVFLLLFAVPCFAGDEVVPYDPKLETDYYEFVFFGIQETVCEDTIQENSDITISFTAPTERSKQVQADFKGVLTGDSVSVTVPNSLVSYTGVDASHIIDVTLNSQFYELRARVIDKGGRKSVYSVGRLLFIETLPPATIIFNFK